MPRIYVVSTVRGTESVVRQLLCEPVVGVSCQGTGHTSKTGVFGLFWLFLSHSRIFHMYGDVTIAGEGLQIFTYVRQLIEGSFACHTYCDTGYPFITVISEDPCTKTYCRACHYLFLRLRSVATGIRTSNLPLAWPTL